MKREEHFYKLVLKSFSAPVFFYLSRYAVVILLALAPFFSMAQNAVVGTGFSSGWGGATCPTGNTNFNYLSASGFGTSYILTTTANGTGNQYWRYGIDWSGTTAQRTITPGTDVAVSPSTTYSLNSTCATSGSLFYNVPNAAYNYIFKTLNAGTNPTGTVVFFEVQGTVRTVSSVTQSPVANKVPAGTAVTVTANLSGAFATGQAVYLRYTANGYTTSTVVQMTGSGTVYTATIPGAFNTSGANISYYVFTSGPSNVAADGSNADLYTINWNNNGGSNYTYTAQPVQVNATNSANDAVYATLGAAFTQINAGTHTGVINISILGNTTETATATLNATGGTASYTAVNIQPSGGGARTISGAIAAGSALVNLNGATNVTINGLNSGGNSLSFSNTTASGTIGTTTLLFNNSASGNTIQNCSVLGSTTNILDAVIEFGSTGNNSNNNISSNTIGPAGSNLPTNGIYAVGTSSNVTISNNNIQDYYNAATSSIGIFVGGSNTGWTISGNRLFQTATRTATAGNLHTAIGINNASGGGFTVSNNIIGYANSSGTGTTTYNGSFANRFVGILLNVSATTSSVQGNTIAGITLSTTSGLTTNPGIFSGIYVLGGNVNIGTTTANNIGVASTGPISITSSTSGALINGIVQTAGSSTISNNSIAGFSVGSGASIVYNVYGINVSGTGSFTINNNAINNISVSTSSSSAAYLAGILVGNTGGFCSVTGNIINNLSSGGLYVVGIRNNSTSVSNPAVTISTCSIFTLSCSNSFGTASGIEIAGSNGGTNIARNKIYDITESGSSGIANGILMGNGGSVLTPLNISNNIIGEIKAPATSSATPFAVQGICINSTASVTVNIYYNSVYITGTSSGANFSAAALYVNTNPTLDLRNNIFVNNCTPKGTGRAVAFQRSSTTLTNYAATSNNNLFYAGTPGASNLIMWDGTTGYQTLATYQTLVTPRDGAAVSFNPNFLSTTGSSANFLFPDPNVGSLIESGAASISGYVNDFAALNSRLGPYPLTGQVNGGGTAPDIGAVEYDGKLVAPPVINAVAGISASPNNGTATNAYVGSTVTISGSGLSGVTIVRYGGSGGTSVGSFTVVNDNTITFTVGSTAFVGQIYVQNPSGNATSVEVLANVGYITNAATVFNLGTTWLGGAVPPASANITIAHNPVTLGTGTYTYGLMIINSGALFQANSTGTLTTTTVTNNGTYNINTTGGTLTTTNFTNAGTLSWTAAGTLNIAASGILTHNTGATFTRGGGRVNFAGAGTINGSAAITFNNLTINTGVLTITTVPTIDGTFIINGGSVSAAPVYTANSTLEYDISYTRGLEWSAVGVGTIGVTPGYPNNVTVAVVSTFNLVNSDAGTARACNGQLWILSASTFNCNNITAGLTIGSLLLSGSLNMNTMSTGAFTINGNATITSGTFNMNTSGSALNIGGNLNLNSGTSVLNMGTASGTISVNGNVSTVAGAQLTLSTTSGANLSLRGNWSNSGTFTPNNRIVEFNGTAAAQTITGVTTFDNLKINNTSGTPTVTLLSAITVNQQLDMTAGRLVLGANNCTIGSSGSIINYTATKYVTTNSTGQLRQTVGAVNVIFPVGNTAFNPVTLNNSGTSDIYGIRVVDGTVATANIPTQCVMRRWFITEAVANGSNLSVNTQYNTGEPDVNFASAVTPYLGFYNGSAWSQQAATQSGSNPFNFQSNSNFNLSASDITAGNTYYFAAGKDNAFLCSTIPNISGFSPTTVYSGDVITLTGTNLNGLTTATIGGVAATINSSSPTSATITVGAGASGTIFVSTTTGCNFTTVSTVTYSGYISAQTGNWNTGSTWRGGAVPAALNAVTIDNGHTVTVDALANPSTVTINPTGTLVGSDDTKQLFVGITGNGTVTNNGTITLTAALVTPLPAWLVCGTLTMGNGSIFNNNCGNAGAVAVTTFSLGSGSTYNHNAIGSSANGSTLDFPGTTITINSNATVNITKWAQNGASGPVTLPTVTGGQWGNLTINITGQTYTGSWQNSGNITNATSLTVTNTGGFDFRLSTMNGTAYTGNFGSITVNGGLLSVINGGGNGTNNATVNVSGNVTVSSGSFTLTGGATGNNYTTGTNNLNITGNLTVSGGTLFGLRGGSVIVYAANTNNINITGNATISSGGINIASFTSYTATQTQTVNLNLSGDLQISGTGSIANTNFAKTTGNVAFNKSAGTQVFSTVAGGINTNPLFFTVGTGTSTNIVSMSSDFPMNTATSTLTVLANASLYCNTGIVTGNTFTLNSGGTLGMGSTAGISSSGATGNVQTTTRNFNVAGNYLYNGVVNQVTGNGLPVTISSPGTLTIANTGTAPNNVVTLTTNNTTTPRINLNAGQFNAGTGGTLIIAAGGIVSGGGGSQYLAGTANDNIIRFSANGAVQGTPELYNITIGNSAGGVDFTNNARINGIFLINNQGSVNPNSPRYAVGSTLIYSPGGSYVRNIEWGSNTAGAPSYPHHVIIQNGTTLTMNGSTPASIGCGGDLTLGNPAASDAGTLDLTTIGGIALNVAGNLNIGGISSNGTLNMSNSIGGDINIGGNWTRTANGTVNFGSGDGRAVFFVGSNNGTITAAGGQTFPFVYINKGAKTSKVTLADNVNITDEISFIQGTVDMGTNNKFLTVLSTAAKTGRVGQSSAANTDFVYGASNDLGQFIPQRYMPARRAWRLMTAPLKPGGGTHTIAQAWQERSTGLDYTAANWAASVTADSISATYGTLITGGSMANGFDQSPNNSTSVKYFNAGVWLTPANTNSTGVNSKEGWFLFVRGDRKNYGEITNQFKTPTITTLRPRGQVFIGTKTIASTGLTVVGNPYASAVDYFTMSRTGTGWPANPTYYMWDPYLGGAEGVGAFITLTWNGTNFTRSAPLTGTGTSSIDNRYIPSGAAIIVDFPAGGGTLTINESDKVTNNTTVAFRPVRQLSTVLNTVLPDGTRFVSDGALSLFGDDFENAVNYDDARKLGNVAELFALSRNENILSVERKKLNPAADTIFYYMARLQRKTYQLQFIMDNLGLPSVTTAFLEDTYLHRKIPVSLYDTTNINFDVTAEAASAASNRFRLVFRKAVDYSSISADVVNRDIVVNWTLRSEFNISRYEVERSIDGRHFVKMGVVNSNGDNNQAVNYQWIDQQPPAGEYYYRIRSITNNGIVVYSDIAKAVIVKSAPGMYVFPNPAAQDNIRLQMNAMQEGKYSLLLFTAAGEQVHSEIFTHNGNAGAHIIRPKEKLSNGVYQLRIVQPDNSVSVIKVLVTDK